jgi:putative transposase
MADRPRPSRRGETPRQYPPELKERAIRLVAETIAEQGGQRHGAVGKVAGQLGIGPESLRHWVDQAEIDAGTRPGQTTGDRDRIHELEARELRAAAGERDPQERRDFLRGGARPPLEAMIRYIDEHRGSFGVEPICRTLQVAPSSYYAAKSRPPSARAVSDATLADVIGRVHRANFGVYGVRKVWKALGRLRIEAGRDQVARVMHLVGLQGATRAKGVRTTKPAPVGERPADLVERVFAAPAPDRLWVADLTYVWTVRGFCYAAFIVDVFSRRIVGWRVATTLRADLALDALEMAVWARGPGLSDLVHHSDRGVQYLSIRYTERLAEAEAVSSVGSGTVTTPSPRASTGSEGRAHPPPRSPARRTRSSSRGLGRLVECRAAPLRLRRHPPSEFEAAYHHRLKAPEAA